MEPKKGLLKCLTIQFAIVFVMALLFHYVWMETASLFDLPEIKFPRSFAIALFLRLWTYRTGFITKAKSS
jgi:hypothetical protein